MGAAGCARLFLPWLSALAAQPSPCSRAGTLRIGDAQGWSLMLFIASSGPSGLDDSPSCTPSLHGKVNLSFLHPLDAANNTSPVQDEHCPRSGATAARLLSVVCGCRTTRRPSGQMVPLDMNPAKTFCWQVFCTPLGLGFLWLLCRRIARWDFVNGVAGGFDAGQLAGASPWVLLH